MTNTNSVDLTLYKEKINTGTSWTRNKVFDAHGYLVIKDLYDPVHLYHPVPPERGLIRYDGSVDKFQHIQQEDQVVGSLSRYHHPQYKHVHTRIRKKLEEIIGRKLYNTYYYDRYYFEGQKLDRHNDRDACEISVTVNIGTNLPEPEKNWPIWIKTPDTYTDEKKTKVLVPGQEHYCILQPGDGMVYKGCERPHWRNPMPTPRRRKRDILLRRKQPTYYYHQIFFHYVLQDGIRSHHAWDMNR